MFLSFVVNQLLKLNMARSPKSDLEITNNIQVPPSVSDVNANYASLLTINSQARLTEKYE